LFASKPKKHNPKRPAFFRPSVEPLEDRTLLDTAGPRVVSLTPLELRNAVFDHLDMRFNEAINSVTFSPDDVVISGPSGTIAANQVSVVAPDTYRIEFNPLTTRGNYQLTLGPNIADLAGNPLDQNQNNINGEATADVFKTTFVYIVANAIFTSGTTINETNFTFDNQDILIDGATVAINGQHSFNSIHVIHGGVLTHTANSATQTHKTDVFVAEQVIIDSTSKIDVTGKGYSAGRTSGNTTVGAASGTTGGSYGGLGGVRGPLTNAVYGDYADPNNWGSGGGGASGGGLVRVQAGSLSLDGQILADGAGGSLANTDTGAGSGGGIYLEVGTLQGVGLIRAAGGGSSPGGGGRVAVYASDYAGFNLSRIQAPAGPAPVSGGAAAFAGAGTVYLRDTDDVAGTLIVDAGSSSNNWTPLGLAGQTTFTIPDSLVVRGSGARVRPEHASMTLGFANVTLTGGAYLETAGPLQAAAGTLTVASSSLVATTITAATLSLTQNAVLTTFAATSSQVNKLDLTVTGQITVDSTSKIDVTGKGYSAGRTSGNTTVGAAIGRAGGSYGGLGVVRGSSAPTNAVYGDYADPEDWGSGGGDVSGGGLVRLHAGSLILEGQLLADGTSGSLANTDTGAGSGGGIYVGVGVLRGAGLIRAAGGASSPGGGGRVAVYAADYSGFDLNRIQAPAGVSGSPVLAAGAGTVHIVQGQSHTHVRFYSPIGQNGGFTSAITSVTLALNKPLDLAAFTPDKFQVTGQMGNLQATGLTLAGDRLYRVELPFALTEDGPYHFTLAPTLLDAEGFQLDQDANGIPGEPLDGYAFDLFVDTVAPRIVQHTPAGDLGGTINSIDVFFSEAIDKTTFTTNDAVLVRPNSQTVAISSIQEVGFNRFRLNFTAQTLVGTYHVKIGPDVRDRAGNKLDQDGDGILGEAIDDVYDATFNLVAVDLGLNNLAIGASQLVAGEPVTVSWSGRNVTGAPLVGNWLDAVYLSTDDRWDIGDLKLAEVPHTGGLAQNTTYTASGNVLIPGKLPGNYRILVRADIANQERETNEADNLVASGVLPLSVQTLTPEVASTDTLTPADRADFYTIQVAPAEILALALDGLASSGINELYVRRDAIPTRQDNDFRAVKDEFTVDGQDHQIVANAPAEGGTYYILVYGAQISTAIPYTLTARTGPLIVDSITPGHHGNSATARVTIRGAGFDDTTSVEFVGSDGNIQLPVETQFVSADTLTLTLDLPSWTADTYDVRLRKGNAEESLTDAFTVTAGGTAKLETNLIVPSAVGFAIPIRQTIWVEYRNTGDVAMPAPLLQLTGTFGARLTTDPTITPRGGFGAIPGTADRVQFLGLGKSATPWLLLPGESVRVPVYYLGLSQAASYPQVTFSLAPLTSGDTREIYWAEQQQHIRPSGISDATWERLVVVLQHQVGKTWGDYVVSTSNTAFALYQEGEQSPTVEATWSRQLQHATNTLNLFGGIDPASISYDGLKLYAESFYSDVQQLPGHDPCNPLHNSLFNALKQIERQKNDLADLTAGILGLEFTFAALDLISLTNAIQAIRGAAAQLPNAVRIVAAANDLENNRQDITGTISNLGASSSRPAVENGWLSILQSVTSGKDISNFIMTELASLPGLTAYAAYWTLIGAVLHAKQIYSHLTFQATQDHFHRLWAAKDAFDAAYQGYANELAQPESGPQIINLSPSVTGPSIVFGVVGNNVAFQFSAFDPDPDCDSTQPLQISVEVAPSFYNLTVVHVVSPGISQSMGVFEWIPSSPGDYQVRMRVTDSGGASSVYELTIRVRARNGSPLLPLGPGSSGSSALVGSFDPNDKLAPSGHGDSAFVHADGSLAYTVRFENKSDATAPARQIVVTDVLDPDLDLDTFAFTEIVFGNQVIAVPAGLANYEAWLAITVNGVSILVDFRATLDRDTRAVTVTLQALDPNTGWFPEDPLVGLLYPENGTGRGQGSVSYLVRPKADLPTGTVIENRATIVFDYNDPIDTPLVRNTLDAAGPSSQVTTLSGTITETTFTLNWAGEDDANGSGIAGYDVYLSQDEGVFVPFLLDTTLISFDFVGELGHTYAFYSVARDNVGHIEAAPETPDAVIFVRSPNDSPVLDPIGNQSVNEGSTLTFTAIARDANAADVLTYSLDTGEPFGASIDPTTGVFTFTPIDGLASFTITIRVHDNATPALDDFETITILVNNVAPGAMLSNGGPVNEGAIATVAFSDPFDPSFDDTIAGFLYSFDLDNDGAFDVVASQTASATVPARLLPDGPATHTVRGRIQDKDGDSTDYTTTITILNVKPTATFTNGGPTPEGSTGFVTFSNPIDSSAADTAAGFTYSYDFDNDDVFEIIGTTSASVTVPAAILNDGPRSRTVRGRIQDKDGGYTDYTTTIAILNVAPTVVIANATVVVNEGSTAANFGTWNDPGADVVRLSASLGTITKNADGTWVWSFDANDGPTQSQIVTITATDSDNESTSTTFNLIVKNLDPVITSLTSSAPNPNAAAFNTPVTIQGVFSDPGSADIHHATISWGDGSQTLINDDDPRINQLSRTFTVNHLYTTGGSFPITVTLHDGDGGSTIRTTTAAVAGVGMHDGVLQIYGTDYRDNIHVSRRGATYRVDLRMNAPGAGPDCDDEDDDDAMEHDSLHQHFVFDVADVSSIVVYARAGNDHVQIGRNVTLDTLIDGGLGNDLLRGGGGNDTITDPGGHNTIRSGAGNDTITTGPGCDRIWTDGGNDTVDAGDGDNEIHAGKGDNTIVAGNGKNRVWTDWGDDVIILGDGNNEIHSGKSRDQITVGNGANRIWTDGGDDTVIAGNGNNEIHAGGGDNHITVGNGNNQIHTGSGNDWITVGNGCNNIEASGGNDTIITGNGNNIILAGAGADTITTGSGNDCIDAGAGDDIVRAGAGNDVIDGGSGNDILVGGDGDDILVGSEGRDMLIGGTGADCLHGNAGDDILIAGFTSYDADVTALTSIMQEWTSSHNYNTRVVNLQMGTGLTRGFRLNGNDGTAQTVFSDNDVDTLTGNQGQDWFFANQVADNGGALDVVDDMANNELWIDTDI